MLPMKIIHRKSKRDKILLLCMHPGGGVGGRVNPYIFVRYISAAGIAPIFQVIYTCIGHDFFSNIR